MNFNKWLDTLIEEKNLNTEHVFEKEGTEWGINYIPLSVVIENIKATSQEEKRQIKNILVAIDFKNGDVMHFFEHLAGALAL